MGTMVSLYPCPRCGLLIGAATVADNALLAACRRERGATAPTAVTPAPDRLLSPPPCFPPLRSLPPWPPRQIQSRSSGRWSTTPSVPATSPWMGVATSLSS